MNILIIMPKFYAYQTVIKSELEARGDIVKIYEEEPPKKQFLIMKNIESILHMKNIYKSFGKKLAGQIADEKPEGGYDFFLCIRGNVLTKENIEFIKENALNKDAKCTYYSWDVFKNVRHAGQLGYAFDRRLTFDSVDAKNLEGYELLPLFYQDAFDKEDDVIPAERDYDFCSISAWFPFRYYYLKAFMEANPDKKFYFKLVIDPDVLKAKKIKEPELYNNLDENLVTTKPFTPEQIRDICLKSKCVVDLAYENQPGLTMRTMETLGIRRKLVTNNKYLKEYEFFNEKNNRIYERLPEEYEKYKNTKELKYFALPDESWLNEPYDLNEEIRAKYSIHAWLDKLIRG